MPIVDDDGDLFGVANAVDVGAVVVVLLLVVGVGFGAVSGADQQEETHLTQTVTIHTDANESEMSEIQPGPTENPDIVEIRTIDRLRSSENTTWIVEVQLRITTTDDGLPQFKGKRLYIGQKIALDLNGLTINGTITGAMEPERIQSVPTPSPTTTQPTTTVSATSSTPTSTTTSTVTTTDAPPPTTTTKVSTTTKPSRTQTFTMETSVKPEVAGGIQEGPVEAPDVIAIREKSVLSENESITRLALRIELAVTEHDGQVFFRGVSIREGTSIRLEFETGTIKGTITER